MPLTGLLGKLLAALVLLAGLLGLSIAWAPVASAHHANLSATVGCPAGGDQSYVVSYEASSWSTGPEGANSDIRVEHSVNGGTWTTGAQLSFPNVPSGSPIPSESGSFTVPADADDVLQVRIKAYADWGNGNTTPGPWSVQTLTLPTGCDTVVDLPDQFEDTDAEDEGNDDTDCGAYDPADGPVWHFVVNQLAPNTPAGSLTATFGPAPGEVTETLTVGADSVNNSLQDFFVQSTQRYLIDAQATFAGAQPTAKLVLSHVCAGPTTEPPVDCEDDETGTDTNGNGVPDTCTPNPPCDGDEVMVDVDGDGVPESCTPNPPCDGDEVMVDVDGDGVPESCTPNPPCDGDEVMVDVDGDGVPESCAEVEGETLTPSTPSAPRGEQVMGETVTRQPAPATQGTTLPRTGGDPMPLTSVAIGLVLAGVSLTRAGRRRGAAS